MRAAWRTNGCVGAARSGRTAWGTAAQSRHTRATALGGPPASETMAKCTQCSVRQTDR